MPDRIDHPTPRPSTRRLAAVGTTKHTAARTITLRATAAGVTGRITAGPGEICDLCGRPYFGNRCPRCTTPAQRPCPTCQGNGGHIEDTSSEGVTRCTWRTCRDCRGTGTAR
ncbi:MULTISPECIES: hypothetical protein [Streptomycetaceae]|uniref:Uncharacterized protein n=1 Tax=Streptantibioticus cattleyicolor (strain ATCC 35852 / DSM 46488 / JCM 4925 / NBRC 14057 / NRRL 8057) TaxID=1003195 RepID=F8JY49_STREN|nr:MULTISPECIES: hypothetical protein [Streptomycetaceae]AEW94623.1 hypothetical protein SCATT_22520 [Streptantibioticus cattleyicolor NRRL 8057 = DSM 46488]MYS59263.1 hypothetical protein [Streptomyces sp. SID5468]CCB74982.1 protein of unknown function [Streptantibioticus cattleyicolor NRRL 8057 = DSM 46488]